MNIFLRARCSHQKSHIWLASHGFPTPALESSRAQRASVYNDAAKNVSFLTKLEAAEEEIREGISALCQTYPEDVEMNLVGEVKNFHQYVRHSQAYGSG